jgi:isoquinoline 1-oxidoreductase beta subunit
LPLRDLGGIRKAIAARPEVRMKNRGRTAIHRREFLKLGTAAGVGLAIGYLGYPLVNPPAAGRRTVRRNDPWLWVKIAPDGQVSVVITRAEMGQGSMTALAMLVAEELDLDWNHVKTEWAPAEPDVYGRLLTGASDAVRTHWLPLRQAGAIARSLLVAAAALRWGVPAASCRTQEGTVVHPPTGRSLGYGALAEAAAGLPLPSRVDLKNPRDFRLIGRSVPRLDLADKTSGKAVFGIDVQLPGMLIATVVHCPVHGGYLESLEAGETMRIPDVRSVVRLRGSSTGPATAVAVVAGSFWAARKGAAALKLDWNEGEHAAADTEGLFRHFRELAGGAARRVAGTGDAAAALARAERTLSATYTTPFLAHAAMEPMNCTAHVRGRSCEIWVPTQDPGWARRTAALVLGIAEERVVVHPTYVGGGFGRRQRADFVAQAVEIARAADAPVKLVWTREEDIRHGYYRPATLHLLRAGLDRRGLLVWTHRVVGLGGSDDILVQGIDDLPYAIPHREVDLVRRERGMVRTGPWRGLAHSQNAFVTESFLDEAAHASGKDPLEMRSGLLRNAPRHRAVVELAAEKAGWHRSRAEGRHLGLALAEIFDGICAQVAEVSITGEGQLRIERIVCAADCGRLVHPDTVRAQMEGGIVFGLTAALKGEITVRDGKVEQSNFHDYPLLRMPELPPIEVHLVASNEDPGAVGETSLPPVAPAVANAVFAATGKRLRALPLRMDRA